MLELLFRLQMRLVHVPLKKTADEQNRNRLSFETRRDPALFRILNMNFITCLFFYERVRNINLI